VSEPAGLARQVALMTCLAVAVAAALSGLAAVGLVRGAYDAQATTVLRQEAALVARLLERPATAQSARPGRPVGRLLAGTGVRVLRVEADGTVTEPRSGGGPPRERLLLTGGDVATVAAGQELSGSRTLGGQRYLLEAQPVGTGGGVVLLQRAADARAGDRGVLRRLGIALVLGLLAAAGLGVLLARRLARPLVRAAAGARRLATGDRDLRLPADGPAEVADVARSLNALAGALAVSEGRQAQFLVSVSHELRTPLTAVRGFAEALEDGVLHEPAEVAAAGATVRAEAERLERLVSDLLDLARLGAEDFRLELVQTDLRALVGEAARVWQRRGSEVGVGVTVELPPAAVPAWTDPARLRQVLDGLAENALRITPAGAPLVLALEARGDSARLQVRDGGPGLTDSDLAVAFERSVLHARYRGVRRVGTGVGLALVAGLVARLGGSVAAGRAREGGAAFTVDLPLAGPASLSPGPRGQGLWVLPEPPADGATGSP